MTCGIYMIQNLVNGKIYIGQGVDIERRWKHHKWELRNNRHDNTHLQNAWNSYKEVNFEFTIICECDESQLNTMEEYYIFELMSYDGDLGYNNSYGGKSGRPIEETKKKVSEALKGKYLGENAPMYGKHHSEESRKKMSASRKGKQVGENNPMYGKHHSEEHKNKISESLKIVLNRPEVRKKMSEALKGENNPMYGKHHSKETRKKISEALKGENSPMYGKHPSEETRKKMSESKKGENNHFYGKHHTEETRKKISESLIGKYTGEKNPMYGKHHSKETRKKISENNYMKGKLGVKCPNSIPIVQLTLDGELVNVYGSSREAERSGFYHSAINCCIKGKAKTHHGYKWMYLSEYEAMKKEG